MWITNPSEEDQDRSKFDGPDQESIDRIEDNKKWGFAYNHEHATKTSTIAIVVSSNPISLLAWIGEKMLVWSHSATTPALDLILANVTLYWITKSYPTGLYHYRTSNGKSAITRGNNKPRKTSKPAGYSHFVNELIPSSSCFQADCSGRSFCGSRSSRGLLGGYQRVYRENQVDRQEAGKTEYACTVSI
jgi:hypothetical protein